MSQETWWFGCRETNAKRKSAVTAEVEGPFSTYEEAIAKREEMKSWSVNVSPPFTAENRDEAQREAESLTGRF